MTTYTLELEIDPKSLRIIKAAQLKVTLAKPVNAISEHPNVAWVVFDPFQGNTVSWEEEYSIYASATPITQNGAVISRITEAEFPASDATYYTLNHSATFAGPFTGSDAPGKGSYKVNNAMPSTQYPFLTFGLEQEASINGSGIKPSPLNAAVVPAALSATFTPLTTVYVWLQAQFTSGTVITQVNGHASIVTFGGNIQKHTLAYNPDTGTFIPSSKSVPVESLRANYMDFETQDTGFRHFRRPGVH